MQPCVSESEGTVPCYLCKYRDRRPVDFDMERRRADATHLNYCRKHQDWCQILRCTFRLSRTYCKDFERCAGQAELGGFV